MESRTQPSRPSTQKKNLRQRTALSRTDPFEAKNRIVGGQGPRIQSASVLQSKNKKISKIKKINTKKRSSREETPIFRKKSSVFQEKKKGSRQVFSKVSADFQGKVRRRSWPWPISKEAKNSAVLELRTRHI